MKLNKYSISVILIAVALLAACSAASPDNKQAQLEKLKAEQAKLAKEISALEQAIVKENPGLEKVKAKEIVIAEIAPRKFDHFVQTQGTVEAFDNILVSAKSMGVLTQVFAREGDVVRVGQVLAQIDNSLITRSIEEVKANLELAKTVYERQKNLWDQKIGTEVQYLQAKNTKEGLDRRLSTLNEQLDMTKIKSPINGTVDAVNVKQGENVAPGIPAFRVINTSNLKVKAKVSEAYITTIEKGDKVTVTFPDLGTTIEARVTFVGRNIDLLTRSFPVEVALPTSPNMRANMTALIRVIFHSEPAALVVPINVVQDVNGEKIVYTAEVDGQNMVARKKPVTIIGVYDNLAEVKTGLKAGDKIITVGYQGLNDGDFVKL